MLTPDEREYMRFAYKEKNIKKTVEPQETLKWILKIYNIKEDNYYENFDEINKKYSLKTYVMTLKTAKHKDDLFALLYPGHVSRYKNSLYYRLLNDDNSLATTLRTASQEYVDELLYQYLKDIITRVFNSQDIYTIFECLFMPEVENELCRLKCISVYRRFYFYLADIYINGILDDKTLSDKEKADAFDAWRTYRFENLSEYNDTCMELSELLNV